MEKLINLLFLSIVHFRHSILPGICAWSPWCDVPAEVSSGPVAGGDCCGEYGFVADHFDADHHWRSQCQGPVVSHRESAGLCAPGNVFSTPDVVVNESPDFCKIINLF